MSYVKICTEKPYGYVKTVLYSNELTAFSDKVSAYIYYCYQKRLRKRSFKSNKIK